MTKLQQIVNKAKQMRKAHPKKYAKWTDYVKAASKSLSGLDSVKRSGNKTTVNYTRSKVAAKKKAAPKKAAVKKKAAPKKKIVKRPASNQGKLFGIGAVQSISIKHLHKLATDLTHAEKMILRHKVELKAEKTTKGKNIIKRETKIWTNYRNDIKKQITLAKKHIK